MDSFARLGIVRWLEKEEEIGTQLRLRVSKGSWHFTSVHQEVCNI